MTIPELLRELADLTEKNEAPKAENATFRAELEATKQHVPSVKKEWHNPAEAANLIRVKPHSLEITGTSRMQFHSGKTVTGQSCTDEMICSNSPKPASGATFMKA